jgi:hypothetical protein
MFDINATINAAISEAVEARVRTLVEEFGTRIADLEEANTVLVERLNNAQPQAAITDPATGMDYFQKAALVEVFIERLNDAEWFWNKVNHYVDAHIEQYCGDAITSDTFREAFNGEWERKVGSNDLLGRDEVAGVVRELWNDEFEDEVDDKVDRAVDNIDLSVAVRDVVRDLSFSVSVD